MKGLSRFIPVSAISMAVGVTVFFAWAAMGQTYSTGLGSVVYQPPGNVSSSGFLCDPGYSPIMFHYDENDSNNADWFECQ